MTTLGTIKGSVSLALGDNPTHEVATFELPITAQVESSGPSAVMVGVAIGATGLDRAVADALRTIADRVAPADA